MRNDDTYDSTMSLETEVRPIEAVRPTEPVAVEATQVLIREARRRQRRRRLIIAGVVFILAVAGWSAAKAIGVGGPTAAPRSLPHSSPEHPIPPPPIIAVGQFAGTWSVHTTSVTIQADGQGSVIWPGPLGPGQSEANAIPSHANLRLTSVRGTYASAQISDSTAPSEVPDGPAQLRVTSQDLLFVIPVHRTEVSPFDPISAGPAGYCGPKALALTLAQQIAAGINCGA